MLRIRLQILFPVPHLAIVAPAAAETADPPHDASPKPSEMVVEALLQDNHWLLFTTDVAPPPLPDPVATQYFQASLGAWMTLSAALVVILSLLAARRLAKPLSELAVAVEHLGASGDAPLPPSKGPRELRNCGAPFPTWSTTRSSMAAAAK
jgi:hypothetical protein